MTNTKNPLSRRNPIDIVSGIVEKRQRLKQEALLESKQLPLWGDAKRGLPNVFARSALFNARRNSVAKEEAREYLKNAPVASYSNYAISYRGEELRQDDASVFMQLLHLARQHEVGDRVYFTAFSMIKSLGWGMNGETYKRLRECIERLAANTVKIQIKDQTAGYGKSLVRAFYWKDDASGESLSSWCVEFEPEIVVLFAASAYTLIEWQERRLIGSRATLALWLHSFLATHESPIPISVAKYYELSESRCRHMFHFRAQLKQSLDRLVEIGFVENYEITPADLVHIHLRRRGQRGFLE